QTGMRRGHSAHRVSASGNSANRGVGMIVCCVVCGVWCVVCGVGQSWSVTVWCSLLSRS
ncbi:hypothetical protein THAOC_28251, partial [Thalassiosira oceanica]